MKARLVPALAIIMLLVVVNSASAAGVVRVPFQAILHGGCSYGPFDPDTGIQSFEVWGQGRATALGKTAWSGETAVNVYQGPPYPYWSNTVTFAAANGDKLFATMEGLFRSSTVSGTFKIIGGAGRFTGATGSGHFWGWTDGTGNNDWIVYSGMLRW